MKNKEYIFVYGTLKFGFNNSGFLLHSDIVDRAITNNLFSLYEGGLPYLTKKAHHQVKGEVYECNAQTISQLDMLEGHPDLYERELISVTLDCGRITKAWCYFFKHPRRKDWILTNGEYTKPLQNINLWQ